VTILSCVGVWLAYRRVLDWLNWIYWQCIHSQLVTTSNTVLSLIPSSSVLLSSFCRLLLLFRNYAHLYRCSTDTHHRKHINVFAIQPLHLCSGWTYRKHMPSVRYPARPLARWLDLQKTLHVTSIHCCVTSSRTQKKTLLQYCWQRARALPSNGQTRHDIKFSVHWFQGKVPIKPKCPHLDAEWVAELLRCNKCGAHSWSPTPPLVKEEAPFPNIWMVLEGTTIW
jgi:hypothetical protein